MHHFDSGLGHEAEQSCPLFAQGWPEKVARHKLSVQSSRKSSFKLLPSAQKVATLSSPYQISADRCTAKLCVSLMHACILQDSLWGASWSLHLLAFTNQISDIKQSFIRISLEVSHLFLLFSRESSLILNRRVLKKFSSLLTQQWYKSWAQRHEYGWISASGWEWSKRAAKFSSSCWGSNQTKETTARGYLIFPYYISISAAWVVATTA